MYKPCKIYRKYEVKHVLFLKIEYNFAKSLLKVQNSILFTKRKVVAVVLSEPLTMSAHKIMHGDHAIT